jgi:hypothetical protein
LPSAAAAADGITSVCAEIAAESAAAANKEENRTMEVIGEKEQTAIESARCRSKARVRLQMDRSGEDASAVVRAR